MRPMGCGYIYACRTCKKAYDVGYGSYGSWIVATTLPEFERAAAGNLDALTLTKNQNVRKVLEEHAGHDIYPANRDYHTVRGGALTGEFGPMGADVVMIPDFGEYERIDLSPD